MASIDPHSINLISAFLAHEQLPAAQPPPQAVDCIVICVSAILHQAEAVFAFLAANPHATKTLVFCGGIGHSTPYLYEAVSKHPKYGHLSPIIQGQPEARVLHMIFTRCFEAVASDFRKAGGNLLIEDQSTNCGQNAIQTKHLLEDNAIPAPNSVIIVQDPTMARRTIASFVKAFAPMTPDLLSWPIIVPRVRLREHNELVYDVEGISAESLWSIPRFLGLLMGEIPRLRDDEHGYGPQGKGFIEHIDIPQDIEQAFQGLENGILGSELAKR
ncbi:YdcF family protein [Aspergillus saccharolyticus JOP 1030-1]|uniref:Uncharacterized protein n=1 Tax=Aspergillus saccharolyticus JOP 1030-1 TaxID=1450539 RepID=A0A318Z8E6_9EURO|nr:hypothetical protein BP01DRAFT_358316 [Aspergillus saccharolyticus JOP 1030-1]PYH43601.1 hypothetical protein BP01DRAFT_358316 [Aspergillus saccharolyticus JOP 1030-1]